MPLFTSLMLFGFKNKVFSSILVFFTSLTLPIVAINALYLNDLNISYVFGSFDKRYAIEFLFNKNKASLLLLIYLIGFFNVLFHFALKFFNNYFFVFFFLFLTGITGLILVNDLFSFYVFIELISISIYGLFLVKKNSTIFKNIFKYLVNNSLASIFLLLGILFVYKASNNLNISILINEFQNNNVISIGMIFIIFALLLKIGFYPMHLVVSRLYEEQENPANLLIQPVLSKTFFMIILSFIPLLSLSLSDIFLNNLTYFACVMLVLISLHINFVKKINTYLAMISIYQFCYLISIITLHKNSFFVNNILRLIYINAFVHLLLLSIVYRFVSLIENFSIIKFTSILSFKKFEKFLFIFCLFIITSMPISYIFFFKFLVLKDFILTKKIFFASFHVISFVLLLNMNLKILQDLFIAKATIENKIFESVTLNVFQKAFYVLLLLAIILTSIL